MGTARPGPDASFLGTSTARCERLFGELNARSPMSSARSSGHAALVLDLDDVATEDGRVGVLAVLDDAVHAAEPLGAAFPIHEDIQLNRASAHRERDRVRGRLLEVLE